MPMGELNGEELPRLRRVEPAGFIRSGKVSVPVLSDGPHPFAETKCLPQSRRMEGCVSPVTDDPSQAEESERGAGPASFVSLSEETEDSEDLRCRALPRGSIRLTSKGVPRGAFTELIMGNYFLICKRLQREMDKLILMPSRGECNAEKPKN